MAAITQHGKRVFGALDKELLLGEVVKIKGRPPMFLAEDATVALSAEQLREIAEVLEGAVMSGFTCECGRQHKFGAYVNAHWNEDLTHTCACGRRHAVREGHVKLLLNQDPPPARCEAVGKWTGRRCKRKAIIG